jgi:hypothetical protein
MRKQIMSPFNIRHPGATNFPARKNENSLYDLNIHYKAARLGLLVSPGS